MLVSLQELDDVRVGENDWAVTEFFKSFVGHQNRNEVNELYGSLLVMIHLGTLDLDKLVADVLSDVQHDLMLKHMLNHFVILSL